MSVVYVLLGLIWSTFVLWMDGHEGRQIYWQVESGHYATANGTVLNSYFKIHSGFKGGMAYETVINYRYQVEGRDFTGARLRYLAGNTSDPAQASSLVKAHPAGSAVWVYYNLKKPQESLLFPGITGTDLLGGLFLAPFNAIILILWLLGGRRLRERLFRPVAGGVKIIKQGGVIRARMPKLDAAVLSLMATGVAGLAAAISLAAMEPSVGLVLKVVTAVFLAGAGVYAGVWLRIRSGIYDLVINPVAKTVKLPATCGRRQPLTVPMADLAGLWMETFEYRTTKGGVTYNYKPRLRFRENKLAVQTLAVWSDRMKADDFTTWLRPKLGL